MTVQNKNRILTRNEEAHLMRQGVLKALKEYELPCIRQEENIGWNSPKKITPKPKF